MTEPGKEGGRRPATPARPLYVVGRPILDHVYRIESMPASGGSASIDLLETRAGGSGPNVASGLASAGHDVRLVGHTGPDAAGEELRAAYRADGVDLRHLRTEAGAATPRCFVLIEPNGERTILTDDPSDHDLPASLPIDALRQGAVLFCRSPKSRAGRMLEAVGGGPRRVAVYPRPGSHPWPAEVLVGSESELPDGWEEAPHDAARERCGPEVRWVIVTRGVRGVDTYGPGGTRLSLSAVKVDDDAIVDRTGAGDSLAAGLCHGLAHDWSLRRALSAGTRWAAASIQHAASRPVDWRDAFDRGVEREG